MQDNEKSIQYDYMHHIIMSYHVSYHHTTQYHLRPAFVESEGSGHKWTPEVCWDAMSWRLNELSSSSVHLCRDRLCVLASVLSLVFLSATAFTLPTFSLTKETPSLPTWMFCPLASHDIKSPCYIFVYFFSLMSVRTFGVNKQGQVSLLLPFQ